MELDFKFFFKPLTNFREEEICFDAGGEDLAIESFFHFCCRLLPFAINSAAIAYVVDKRPRAELLKFGMADGATSLLRLESTFPNESLLRTQGVLIEYGTFALLCADKSFVEFALYAEFFLEVKNVCNLFFVEIARCLDIFIVADARTLRF